MSDTHDHDESIQAANAFINMANDRLEAGEDPLALAEGMRHAAANFTAFAVAHGTGGPLDYEQVVGEFVRFLEYYDARHRGEVQPRTALEQLVDQVKNE